MTRQYGDILLVRSFILGPVIRRVESKRAKLLYRQYPRTTEFYTLGWGNITSLSRQPFKPNMRCIWVADRDVFPSVVALDGPWVGLQNSGSVRKSRVIPHSVGIRDSRISQGPFVQLVRHIYVVPGQMPWFQGIEVLQMLYQMVRVLDDFRNSNLKHLLAILRGNSGAF